jgi:hypothetical protein
MRDTGSTTELKERTVNEPMHGGSNDRPAWETPRLEDVSEQVMAQPYIRFT